MKYKSVEEGSKAGEFQVSCDEENSGAVTLNIQVCSDHFQCEVKCSLTFPGLSDARSSLQDKRDGPGDGHQQTSGRIPALALQSSPH